MTNEKKKGYGAKVIELPKNKKANRKETHNKKIWLYGLPCSGKTFLANQFPNVLMLNTDGNIGQVDAPAIKIADEIIIDGRLTKRRYVHESSYMYIFNVNSKSKADLIVYIS